MKQSRTVAAALDEGCAALEALVLAELDSLKPAARETVVERAAASRAEPAPPAEAAPHRRERARVTPLRRVATPRSCASGDGYPGERGSEGPDVGESRGASSLSSPEEQAFITRAVTFLSGREHADIILGRVWEQLLELAPNGFYEPPAEATSTEAGGSGGLECGDTGAAPSDAGGEAP